MNVRVVGLVRRRRCPGTHLRWVCRRSLVAWGGGCTCGGILFKR